MSTMIPGTEEVEIMVAAVQVASGVDFHTDARLIRTGLLYADRVTVFSLFGTVLDQITEIAGYDEDELIEFMLLDAQKRGADGYAVVEGRLREYQRLRAKRHRTSAEIQAVMKMRRDLKRLSEQLGESKAHLFASTGADAFLDLVNTGYVTVHTIDTGTPWEHNPDGIIEYLWAVTRHLATGSSYPLLHETVSNLLAPLLKKGDLIPLGESLSRTKRAALAADLLDRIPTIDELSAADIVAIREDLKGPLLRFRAAMMQLSRELNSAPWQGDFATEAQLLYDAKVVPALLDIADAMENNRLLPELLSLSGKAAALPATSALGMLIAKAEAVPSLLVTGLAAIAGAGIAVNDAVRKWQSNQASIERNQLFYYWKLLQR